MRYRIVAIAEQVEITLASTNFGPVARKIALLYCGEKSAFDFVAVIDTENENDRIRYVPASQFDKIVL